MHYNIKNIKDIKVLISLLDILLMDKLFKESHKLMKILIKISNK